MARDRRRGRRGGIDAPPEAKIGPLQLTTITAEELRKLLSPPAPPDPEKLARREWFPLIWARCVYYDTIMWQAPVLGMAAQAFLFPVVFDTETFSIGRVAAAWVSCLSAFASIWTMRTARKYCRADARWLRSEEQKQLGDSEEGKQPEGVVPHHIKEWHKAYYYGRPPSEPLWRRSSVVWLWYILFVSIGGTSGFVAYYSTRQTDWINDWRHLFEQQTPTVSDPNLVLQRDLIDDGHQRLEKLNRTTHDVCSCRTWVK